MNDKEYIANSLDRIHTTPMGVKRIARNLALRDNGEDVISFIRAVICSERAVFYREGKNIYVEGEGCRITVNASSLSVITAHRL